MSHTHITEEICPFCGKVSSFNVYVSNQRLTMKCTQCGLELNLPLHPSNWKELGLTIEEVITSSRNYTAFIMSLAERGICPICWSRIPRERRKVSPHLIEELGREFHEFNAECPKCGNSFGWASFMKLIMTSEPVRAFLFNVREFEVVPDSRYYEVYGRTCFKLSFRARDSSKELTIYMDKDTFSIVKILAQD